MILPRILFGTTLTATTTTTAAVLYFSPPLTALKKRRRNLLGLETNETTSTASSSLLENVQSIRDSTGLFRFGVAASTVTRVAYDYYQFKQLKQRQSPPPPSTSVLKAMKINIDQTSAERMFQLCKRLGGVYTKLGQYVATLNHVLPSTWTTTLAQLQDSAASLPLKGALEDMIEQELGAPLSELFSEFDSVPIAAASLAQVHRAVIKSTGMEVAVKLQYPQLDVQVISDLWAMETIATAIGHFFPDFSYGWLLPEFEKSADMELDFRQENRNSKRMKQMLCARNDVHVPFVVDALSSRKILTMEYVRGVRVDDVEGMKQLGIVPQKVAQTITSIFGEMIHRHGFIHCDPHPGNLLVRPKKVLAPKKTSNTDTATKVPEVDHEILLLDHGMYRRLEPSFRRSYCKLWKALLIQDIALGTKSAKELGIGQVGYDRLSLILTFRTSTSKVNLGNRWSTTEKKKFKEKYKNVTAGDINTFMESLPRDMLFVLRTTDIVRSLNKTLGGTSRARFTTMGEWAIRGLFVPCLYADVVSNGSMLKDAVKKKKGIRYRKLDLIVDSEYSKSLGYIQPNVFQKCLQFSELWSLRLRLWMIDFLMGTYAMFKEGERNVKRKRVLG